MPNTRLAPLASALACLLAAGCEGYHGLEPSSPLQGRWVLTARLDHLEANLLRGPSVLNQCQERAELELGGDDRPKVLSLSMDTVRECIHPTPEFGGRLRLASPLGFAVFSGDSIWIHTSHEQANRAPTPSNYDCTYRGTLAPTTHGRLAGKVTCWGRILFATWFAGEWEAVRR